MGPVAMLRPPPGISSQTQPDGRSVNSVFPSRLGQRGIAPLGVRPLDEPRRRVEIAERHVLHAVGVQQRRRVLPEHRPEGARGRREAERAAGLGVHVRHGQRQVRRGEPVEPEAGSPLGSSFLISTWFRSQAPFWSLRLGSQRNSLVSPGPSPSSAAMAPSSENSAPTRARTAACWGGAAA